MELSWHALIVAGGTGTRFNGISPKQFALLKEREILLWSVETFLGVPGLRSLTIVSHPDWIQQTRDLIKKITHKVTVPVKMVAGGERRQDSCVNGLTALPGTGSDLVLIHDAARPLVDRDLIMRIVTTTSATGAAVPVIAPLDSLAYSSNNIITAYLDRSTVSCIQTPQGFHLDKIRAAHDEMRQKPSVPFTDDGSVMVAAGYPVVCVQGSPKNIKITTKEDLFRAEQFVS
jgi:2-C-methyl-D-erythritol 4-phosphate cytidylyltransferase